MKPTPTIPLEPAIEMLAENRYEAAARWLTDYLRATPADAEACWLLVGAAMHAGDHAGAERAARACIGLLPGNAMVHSVLGEILACQDRLGEAEVALRAALKMAPRLPHAVITLARVLQSQGRHDEVLRWLAAHAGLPAAHALRAHSMLAQRRWPEAIDELRLAHAYEPDNASVAAALAGALLEARQVRAAAEVARAALVRCPRNARLLHALAKSLIAQRGFAEAEDLLRKVLQLQPRLDAARIHLAELVWMRRCDRAEAVAVIDDALQASPERAELRAFKARLLEWAGSPVDALHELEFGLHLDPSNGTLQLATARAALRLDPEESLRLARQAVAQAPRDAAALLACGNALLAVGQSQAAACIAEKMRGLDSHDGHALALLASAWRALGDARYREIFDYEHLVRAERLDVPHGWSTLQDYLADLTHSLQRMHTLNAHPIGQTLRTGTQVDLSADRSDGAAIRAFDAAIRGPVQRYIRAVGRGTDPLRSRASEHWALRGLWSVKLRPNGHHVNHYHPEGWLSSACYIHLPNGIGASDRAGWLQFGEPGFPTRPPMPAEYFVKPEPGLLVLFPAYMWHGTIPFSGAPDDYRLTMAFDVVPR